ncbi:MAG TPA: hypothetical protein VGM76_03700 [Lacipirellulaceae bacterium]
MLATHETTLNVFRNYLVSTGEMLCFHGPNLEEHRDALRQMTALGLLTKENVSGGYSLTKSGFAAMSGGGNN